MTSPMDYYPGGTPHKLKDFIDTDKMRSKGMKWVGWDKENYLIWITPDGMMHRFKELPRSDIGKEWERYNDQKLTCNGDGNPRVPSKYMWKTKYTKNRDGEITDAKLIKRDLYEAEFLACKDCALCIKRDGVVSDDSTGSSVAGGDRTGGISLDGDDGPGDPTKYGTTDYSTAGSEYGAPGTGANDEDGWRGAPSATGGGIGGSSVTDPEAKANILEKAGLGIAGGSNSDTWVDSWMGKTNTKKRKNTDGENWEDGLTIITMIFDRNGMPLPEGTRVPYSDVNGSQQIQENARNLANGYVVAGTKVVRQPTGNGKMVVETLEYRYPYNGNDLDYSDTWNGGEPKPARDKLQLTKYSTVNLEPPVKQSFTPIPPRQPLYQPPTWTPRPVVLPPFRPAPPAPAALTPLPPRSPTYSPSTWQPVRNITIPPFRSPSPAPTVTQQQNAQGNAVPTVGMTWDPVSDRRIRTLDPRLQPIVVTFINRVERETGVRLRVTQGTRTIEEQNRLYAQGRTTNGPRVTNARGGESFHNFGLAIDVAPVVNGQVDVNTPPSMAAVNIARQLGFDWGGNWRNNPDRPHFEMTFGQTLNQLRRQHGINLPPRTTRR